MIPAVALSSETAKELVVGEYNGSFQTSGNLNIDGKHIQSYDLIKIISNNSTDASSDKKYSAYLAWSIDLNDPNTDFYLEVNSIKRSGNDDGIMLNNWGPSFVGKNLEIVINAYKSDGINVTWDAASDSNPELTSFVKAENVDITVNSLDGDAYGLRVNGAKIGEGYSFIGIAKNAVIRMTNGGTGVFAGIAHTDNRFLSGSAESLSFGGFSGKRAASIVNLNGNTFIELGKNSFIGKSVSFEDAGLYTRYRGTINALNINIDSYGSGDRDVYGIYAAETSNHQDKKEKYRPKIFILGNTKINMTLGEKGKGMIYALKSKEGIIEINKDQNSYLYTQIKGDIDNEKGTISSSFLGNHSFLTGASTLKTGKTDLTFGNGATWNITGDSKVTNLVLSNGSKLDFTHPDLFSSDNNISFRQLTAGTLSGSNSTLRMKINLADEGTQTGQLNLDQMTINGQATGAYTLAVDFINGLEGIAQDKYHSENWLIRQESADSTVTITGPNGNNTITGNGMVSTWSAKFVAADNTQALDNEEGRYSLTNEGNGIGDWYLIRTDEAYTPTPDPDPTPKPDPDPEPERPHNPEVDQNINLGISATQALSFASEIEDLRTRLGEVRYGAQDGAWARGTWIKEHAEGANHSSFEQKTTGIHVGLDRLVSQNENHAWLVGGAFRYAESDQKGYSPDRASTGTLDQYSAKLYATWMHDSGSYADFVLQAGRYLQELKGTANDGFTPYRASYDTWGFGASIEAGRMITLSQDDEADDRPWYGHWFLEPQAQLAYFRAQGQKYRTSTGMTIDQEDADFLTGRLGAVLGKKFSYGSLNDLDKRWFQVALTGGMKYEFLGDQKLLFTGTDGISKVFDAKDMGGVRWYYGVMADWQATDDLRFYAQLTREEGNDYTKEAAAQIGLKYQF